METFAPLILVVAFALGVVTGGFSNVTSGGAGIFSIYFLTTYAGMQIQASTGTVLSASTIIVLIGAISFYRKGQVDMSLALTLGFSGVVGAFLAARYASTLKSSTLEEAFGAFTLVLAVITATRILSTNRKNRTDPAIMSHPATDPVQLQNSVEPSSWSRLTPPALAVQIGIGLLIGAATGVFGVGLAGLSLLVLITIFRLEINSVLGTSLVASFFRYFGGSVGYLTTGQVDLTYFFILVLGGGIGSILGARIVLGAGKGEKGKKEIYIRAIVVVMLLFISYEFLLKHLLV